MIVKMKRLTLIALREEEQEILKALQALAAVQVIETRETSSEDPALLSAQDDVSRLTGAMSILKPYAKKPSILKAKPEESLDSVLAQLPKARSIAEKLEALERQKASLRAEKDKCRAEADQLMPFASLDFPMEQIASTRSIHIFAGFLKVENLDGLSALGESAAIETYGGEKQRAVLIAVPLSHTKEAEQILKSLDFAEFTFPASPRTPAAQIAAMEERIREMEAEEAKIEEQLSALAAERQVIAEGLDASVIERDRTAAGSMTQKTASVFILEGWMSADKEEEVRRAVATVTDAYALTLRDAEEDEIPPVLVANSRVAEPFEAVQNLYSRPAPGSIDGTPFMTPFYILLFGMMVSDTGYGLVLALGALLFLRIAKPTGMMGQLTRVILWGGISTVIWGFLIGTFCGMSWNELLFGSAEGPFPLILDPMNDPINMLFLCFGLGLVHIFTGMIIKIYMCLRDGDWQTAVFDNMTWIVIIIGLLLLLAVPGAETVGGVLAAVGALLILVMKGRGKKNPLKRAASGLGELYQVTSFLSDVLSYARLFALGIATGVIGSVFNQLGAMLMSADALILKIFLTILAVCLLIALHLFNIGINTLGAFVHCARLQYVEFYGKFYEPGGREFRPLGYRTRSVKLNTK